MLRRTSSHACMHPSIAMNQIHSLDLPARASTQSNTHIHHENHAYYLQHWYGRWIDIIKKSNLDSRESPHLWEFALYYKVFDINHLEPRGLHQKHWVMLFFKEQNASKFALLEPRVFFFRILVLVGNSRRRSVSSTYVNANYLDADIPYDIDKDRHENPGRRNFISLARNWLSKSRKVCWIDGMVYMAIYYAAHI
ncbi:hypothetical protein ABKN59_009630 [Abortiporus biennis]